MQSAFQEFTGILRGERVLILVKLRHLVLKSLPDPLLYDRNVVVVGSPLCVCSRVSGTWFVVCVVAAAGE